jgi:hypothetical protein
MKTQKLLWLVGGLAAAFFVLVAARLVVVYAEPYTSAAIPADCTTGTSHLPAAPTYDIPGIGSGTLLTADATSALVVRGDYGRSPFQSRVYLIDKAANRVLLTLTFNDDIFAAAFNGRTLYLYDDAVLYRIDTVNGQTVGSLLTSDNYRQILTAGGMRRMQTDAIIFEFGGTAGTAINLHLNLATMAYGCILSHS